MLAVERWSVFYADGSTFTSEQGTWSQCPPFGVIAVVYYLPQGRTIFDEQGRDDAIHVWPSDCEPPTATGVVSVDAVPEGCTAPVKMGLWTDGDSYWRIHDLARRAVTP